LFLNPRTPRARHEVCALTSGAETASADKLNED
jgi:hypothetical protein